ncbi:MAG: hypothetical protein J07HQX50_01566 [Haloquadratum sp. J07HQX50]|nr:MAG: hypothetical protein J07HQX50_01566 [Haloquadratum sp. J07HQX50]
MRGITRYLVAALVGITAGAAAVVLARPVVDPGPTVVTGVFTGVGWVAAIIAFLPVHKQLRGRPIDSEDTGATAAVKWGGATGGAASLGVTGTAALVLFQHQSLRYAAAVGLFVFGIIMLCLGLGMRVVALRLSAATSGDQQIIDHE